MLCSELSSSPAFSFAALWLLPSSPLLPCQPANSICTSAGSPCRLRVTLGFTPANHPP
uniref:Uncharacterized protein n=1 Tax=Arundo donax TaxID=35708 RepID=A0A0A9GH12_ARUDO